MKQLYAAKFSRLLAASVFSFLLAGCSIFDKPEPIPSYIQIDSIPLNITNPLIQGSSSSKISDAWVYVDGFLVGAFELPCKLPVLSEGSHKVLIIAGVKQNGLSSLRAQYPFYKGWQENVNLIRGAVTVMQPVVEYFPGLDFTDTWMEDFDGTGLTIANGTGTVAQLHVDNLYGPFEGKSGRVQLNADTIEYVGVSTSFYTLNASENNWLELNYKCNESFVVGLMCQGQPFGACEVLAQEQWNKIYINLQEAIAEASQVMGSNTFQVYIAMHRTSSTVDQPTLFIDNIKLLK
ncbi:MAG TPA: hypothetical protein VI731_04700 [Bacteroidia bacterium]|nr:hypothetical protein [Bacteroidia bacterium]